MNKLIPQDLSERRNIASWEFYPPLKNTDLTVTDIDDHKFSVEQVYQGMLHEVSVIDDCRRRFEMTFGWKDFS